MSTANNIRNKLSDSRKNPDTKYQTPNDIVYKYIADDFKDTKADPSYVNQGETKWKEARAHWIREVGDDEDDFDDMDEWIEDVDHIITQMRQYKPFSEPVPLALMAELLEVVWIENPTL